MPLCPFLGIPKGILLIFSVKALKLVCYLCCLNLVFCLEPQSKCRVVKQAVRITRIRMDWASINFRLLKSHGIEHD